MSSDVTPCLFLPIVGRLAEKPGRTLGWGFY